MRKITFLLCLLCSPPAFANEYASVVDTAIANVSRTFHESWAFTEVALEDGEEVVGRYDPGLPRDSRWTLLSIDGREPTDEEIEDFADDKQDSFSDKPDSGNSDFQMVDRESLALLEETNDYWLFSFSPADMDSDDKEAAALMGKVDGRIKIMRDGPYPAYIDMRNRKPVRPATGVKISKFVTRLEFGPADDDGPIVPLRIDVQIKARAMLVISIDEKESIQYTDFKYAGF